jgi:AbrB family looped-hinge helix DNA binding protein
MLQHIATVTTKGQVTIPVEIRRRLGVPPHEKIAFLIEKDQILLASAKSVVAQTAGILKGEQPTLSAHQEKVAAEEAMAEEVEKSRP